MVFCGAVVYVLFFSNFLLINSIEVSGAVNADREIIEEIGQNAISGKYLNFLEKRNIILADTGKIKRESLEKFKIIQNVEVKRIFPDKLKIIISEREPAIIFSGAGRCFVADKNGVIFDEADCEGRYLKREDFSVLVNESNKEPVPGENYVDAEYVNFISLARSGMESDLEIILEKEMRTPGIVSADIALKTKEGWSVFLNEKISAEKELEMLQVILENKITAEQRKNLEYIDLRTENRVYYKFKNGENPNQESSQKPEEKSEDKKEETKPEKKNG